MKQQTIVAIDGTNGSGKSTVARRLAERLGMLHIDTGAMYRTVAWAARQREIDPADEAQVGRLVHELSIELRQTPEGLEVYCNGEEATDAIRTPEVSRDAPSVADNIEVRRVLVERQRQLGLSQPSVMEGRDISTVVFPDASHKFFMTADLEERVQRRYEQLVSQGKTIDLAELRQDLAERDQRDRERKVGGLKVADGAQVVDTTAMSINEVVEYLARQVQQDSRPPEMSETC